MKVSLVVAAGAHLGKSIPILGKQFVIGRDPECQLRPASQAVSKQHCAIVIRDGKVLVKDFGSTNGTFVNDERVPPETEREVNPGDRLKLGPLDFRVEISTKPSDSTPLPDDLRTVDSGKAAAIRTAAGQPPAAPAAPKPERIPGPPTSDDENEAAAAMLLGMGDESDPKVPEGSTVFEMTGLPTVGEGGEKKPEDEAKDKKKIVSREDTSNAASDILRRYMRRPR
jgi:predicted component of type VI protein secretion system